MPLRRLLSLRTTRSMWIAVAVTVSVLYALSYWYGSYLLLDYGVYYESVHRLMNGTGMYNNPPEQMPFTYPPIAAYLLIPLTMWPEQIGICLFTGVSVLAMVRCVYLLSTLGLPRLAQKVQLVLIPVLVMFTFMGEPSHETYILGQINFVLLWLVLEDFYGAVPERFRGVLTGVAASIKLTPLLIIGLLFIGRRWRPFFISTASFAAMTAVGFALAFKDSVQYWSGMFSDVNRVGVVFYANNQSYRGAVARLYGHKGNDLLWITLVVLTFAACVFVSYYLMKVGDLLGMLGVAGVSMCLISPISWSHHWIWAYPAFIWLARSLWTRQRHPWLLITAGAVFWTDLYNVFPKRNDVEIMVSIPVRLATDAYVLWGMAFMVVMVWSMFASESVPVPPEHGDDSPDRAEKRLLEDDAEQAGASPA